MEISIEDFTKLSAEQSRREVQIAKLEMELHAQKVKYEGIITAMAEERETLLTDNIYLKEKLSQMEASYENVRFENRWMRQYILLSVERVKRFFTRMRSIEMLSAVKTFVMDVMPENASPEQIAFASQMMQLPMTEETPMVVNVSGDYNVEKKVEHEVRNVGSGATGISIN